ncbi:hypothetical protein T492DRAFT_833463 [Pavlovales sp. CCMP2436]|nr:hypothetical protein T492DRAFT_833463 [Pavlovales sp. CCMP2436]
MCSDGASPMEVDSNEVDMLNALVAALDHMPCRQQQPETLRAIGAMEGSQWTVQDDLRLLHCAYFISLTLGLSEKHNLTIPGKGNVHRNRLRLQEVKRAISDDILTACFPSSPGSDVIAIVRASNNPTTVRMREDERSEVERIRTLETEPIEDVADASDAPENAPDDVTLSFLPAFGSADYSAPTMHLDTHWTPVDMRLRVPTTGAEVDHAARLVRASYHFTLCLPGCRYVTENSIASSPNDASDLPCTCCPLRCASKCGRLACTACSACVSRCPYPSMLERHTDSALHSTSSECGYKIGAVSDSTSIAELLDDISAWLSGALIRAAHGQCRRKDLQLLLIAADGTAQPLAKELFAGEVNLHEHSTSILVCTLAGGLCRSRAYHAHAAYDQQAPDGTDHLRIARNLYNAHLGEAPDPALHLDLGARAWTRLARTLAVCAQQPECICFHCWMAMYPSEANCVTVAGLSNRDSCRAYVEFKKEIDRRAAERSRPDKLCDAFDIFKC